MPTRWNHWEQPLAQLFTFSRYLGMRFCNDTIVFRENAVINKIPGVVNTVTNSTGTWNETNENFTYFLYHRPPPPSRKQPLKRCASNYSSCRSMDEIAFAIWILNMFTKRTYNSSTTVMYEHKHKTTFLKRFFFLSKKIILETLILSKHKILNYPHQKLIKWNSLCNFMQ